jgi:hypothetical protein
MWDFGMDRSGAGAGFLRELRFPLPIYIPSASPQSSSLSPEAGTIGQSGRTANGLTNQMKRKKKHTLHAKFRINRSRFLEDGGRKDSLTHTQKQQGNLRNLPFL